MVMSDTLSDTLRSSNQLYTIQSGSEYPDVGHVVGENPPKLAGVSVRSCQSFRLRS